MKDFTWNFSLSSPLDIVEANRGEIPAYATKSARNVPAQTWNGNVTHDEALQLAETGWTDAPNLSELAERIAPTETRISHEMQHAVSGAFVDVSRYVEGHPEDMLEFCDEPAPRQIRLAVDLCKECKETARQLELAGAVALAVIDTLNRSGFVADLMAFAVIESGVQKGKKIFATGRKSLTSFPLARAGEPIDPDQLAFWLCHPAALRQLIFGFWDTCPKDFYQATKQHQFRGAARRATPQDVGADYVLSCSPSTEEEARREYHRIISEITATL